MKKLIIFIAVAVCMANACQNKQSEEEKNSPIEGAWKAIYGSTIFGDSVIDEGNIPFTDEEGQMKIWTGKHFLFTGRFKNDTTFRINAGGGTFILEGDQYEENILYHTTDSYLGKKVKMTLKISNDTLYQSWVIKYEGKDYNLEERYVRLD